MGDMNPNGIWIGSAICAQHIRVTDTQKDHIMYNICNNKLHPSTVCTWCGLAIQNYWPSYPMQATCWHLY